MRANGTALTLTLSQRERGPSATWLRRQGQSERAIERFWSVVLVSALGETVDHASLAAARKVFRDGFLASRGASDLVLPRLPLGEIFHDRVGKWLADQGVTVHLGTPVRQIEGEPTRADAVVLADGTRQGVRLRDRRRALATTCGRCLPTTSWRRCRRWPTSSRSSRRRSRPFISGSTARSRALPHAVLVGRLSQWVFARHCGAGVSPAARCRRDACTTTLLPGRHQCLASAARAKARRAVGRGPPRVGGGLAGRPRAVRGSLHGRVVTQPAAVFSVPPGVDRFRPPQQTPIENLALAGDWTATGWPATMEGAVRSGYRAVEALSPAFSR